MYASQLSTILALASIGLASPVTSSCPSYSEISSLVSEGASSCATGFCIDLIRSTSTSTVTGIPTTTVYTTVIVSPVPGTSTYTDVVSTVTSTLSVPVTEASFVYTRTNSAGPTNLPGPTYAKQRRQDAAASPTVGSCPLITIPAAADASAASAACSCYLTSVPTTTRTVTQPPPGQCGPGTVTTTLTVTSTNRPSYITTDATSTVYTNVGPTSTITKQCVQPSAQPNLPYCSGSTQSFGLISALCGPNGYFESLVTFENSNTSYDPLIILPIQQATQFRGIYYTTPSINSGTHQELAPWFSNVTHTQVTQEDLLTTGDNAYLISAAGIPLSSTGPGYQCDVSSTDVHPWNCYYDNKPVNWFMYGVRDTVYSGYGGLADASGNYTQVALWYVPTCQVAPPTTNE